MVKVLKLSARVLSVPFLLDRFSRLSWSIFLDPSKSEKFNPPIHLGEWHVLLRLESLQPARLDDDMKKHLLNVQLNAFLEERVQRRLKGEFLPQLDYDPSYDSSSVLFAPDPF